MPKNLLIITQKVDANDDLLGFFPAWIGEFARHYEHVSVIALGAGETRLPSNVTVYSLGKERGNSKFFRLITFYKLLFTLVPKSNAIFAHMSPIFAIAAWPFTKFWHKRLVLWYLHRSHTLRLRLALALCDALVTADSRSLTIRSPKIHTVGHGIDVARYAVPDRQAPDGRPLRILSVGRISPIKGFETLIRAAALLRDGGKQVEVHIVGRPIMSMDVDYLKTLQSLVANYKLQEVVKFVGFVPHQDMPAQYLWADIVVGCTPPGGIDKVLLEAMAAGCVVLTSNTVMSSYLGEDAPNLIFPSRDAHALADLLFKLDDFDLFSARMVKNIEGHTVQAVTTKIIHYL